MDWNIKQLMLLGIFVAHLDKYVYICFQVLCILLTKAISCLMHIGFAKKHIYMFSLRKNYRLIPLLLPLIISCSGSIKEQQGIVAEWTGKEIVIPEGLEFQVGNIPVDYDFDAADFKIVTYVDSSGCTNCQAENMRCRDHLRSRHDPSAVLPLCRCLVQRETEPAEARSPRIRKVIKILTKT